MKASEFRLGNYVIGQDGKFKVHVVTSISANSVHTQPADRNLNWTSIEPVSEIDNHTSARPLVLNEEWLLKFGFTSDDGHKSFHLSDTNLWVRQLSIGYSVSSQHDKLVEVQFVNQLQNLYYALTGEELTIK
jgi:hypothetical protein